MPRLAQAVLVFAFVAAGCATGPIQEPGANVYEVLAGDWGWIGSEDCAEAPIEMRFSDGGKRMHLSHSPEADDGSREPRRETSYTVLKQTESALRMSMDDEDRLDISGNPVMWDLVLLSNDEYCWHRTDWQATSCTQSVLRCEI